MPDVVRQRPLGVLLVLCLFGIISCLWVTSCPVLSWFSSSTWRTAHEGTAQHPPFLLHSISMTALHVWSYSFPYYTAITKTTCALLQCYHCNMLRSTMLLKKKNIQFHPVAHHLASDSFVLNSQHFPFLPQMMNQLDQCKFNFVLDVLQWQICFFFSSFSTTELLASMVYIVNAKFECVLCSTVVCCITLLGRNRPNCVNYISYFRKTNSTNNHKDKNLRQRNTNWTDCQLSEYFISILSH